MLTLFDIEIQEYILNTSGINSVSKLNIRILFYFILSFGYIKYTCPLNKQILIFFHSVKFTF